jgi:hypothetical protein
MDMTIPEGVGTSCPGRLGDNTKVTSKAEDVTVHSCIMQVTIKQEESSDDDQRLHFCIKLFRKTQRLGHHPFAEGRHQSQRDARSTPKLIGKDRPPQDAYRNLMNPSLSKKIDPLLKRLPNYPR